MIVFKSTCKLFLYKYKEQQHWEFSNTHSQKLIEDFNDYRKWLCINGYKWHSNIHGKLSKNDKISASLTQNCRLKTNGTYII